MTSPAYAVLTEDYTFRFDTGGITLNSALNVPSIGFPIWDVQKVSGLDLPEVKTSIKEFDGIDGGVLDAENIKMRTITIEGALIAHPDDSLEHYLDLLKANYAPVPRDTTYIAGDIVDRNTRPFYIKAPGVGERFIYVKPVGLKYEWGHERRFNSTPFQIILQAEDPILYSPQSYSATMSINSNFVLGYNGNYPGYITAIVSGACTQMQLRHVEADRVLIFNPGATGSLIGIQTATVNFKARTAIKSNGDNMRGAIGIDQWWRLRKGVNTLSFIVSTGTPTVTWIWRDGWY